MSDHPADKATWTIRATVPAGLSVISNGELRSQRTRNGQSTFVWNEPFPMANYLVTADVGNWVHPLRPHARTASPRPSRSTRRCRPSTARARSTSSTTRRPRRPTSGARPSARTRSTRPARSPTTPTTTARRSASRWRRRRGRCTPTCAATRRSPTSSPTSGSATASRCRRGPTSGSTRASRRFAQYLWDEHKGARTRPRRLPAGLQPRRPTGLLADQGGRPAARHDVRQRGLPPRRDDAAGAAREDRRRRRSSASCATGRPSTPRQRARPSSSSTSPSGSPDRT